MGLGGRVRGGRPLLSQQNENDLLTGSRVQTCRGEVGGRLENQLKPFGPRYGHATMTSVSLGEVNKEATFQMGGKVSRRREAVVDTETRRRRSKAHQGEALVLAPDSGPAARRRSCVMYKYLVFD